MNGSVNAIGPCAVATARLQIAHVQKLQTHEAAGHRRIYNMGTLAPIYVYAELSPGTVQPAALLRAVLPLSVLPSVVVAVLLWHL